MKTSAVVCCLVAVFGSFQLLGQGQADIWYFGEGVGLDFSSGDPEPITGGNVFGNPQAQGEYLYSEGAAVVSDSEGNLLFYSNGEKAWNANDEVMPNGGDLMGMYSSTTAAFIVPKPESDSLFYLFTTDGLERHLENGLRYSLVDMCADNGNGDVVPEEKNILLLDTATEKLTAAYHANGTDIWLVAHKYNSDAFYSYLITENGIVDTVISNVGSVHTGIPGAYGGFAGAIGQMKISPDGNKLALVYSNANPIVAELFDFDAATGVVQNHVGLNTVIDGQSALFLYSVEFSPDNSKLYLYGLGLFQFDLSAGMDSVAINDSGTVIPIGPLCTLSSIQLAPNDKIYVGRCGAPLGVINAPNNPGVACDYVENEIGFGAQQANGIFPSFIAGLEYQNKIPECTLLTGTEAQKPQDWVVFPNPASDRIEVRFAANAALKVSVEMIDMSGRVVYSADQNGSGSLIVDVSHLAAGPYFLRLSDHVTTARSELVVVQR